MPTILLKEDGSNGSGVLGKDNYRCRYSYHYAIYDVGIITDTLGVCLSCKNSAILHF